LKLLSDVILAFLLLSVAVLFLTGNSFATSAYSADVQEQSKSTIFRPVIHDLNPMSVQVIVDQDRRESLVLELGWMTEWSFSREDMRGTLFIDRADSPVGWIVACRLDTSRLRVSPRLTVRIPIEDGDSGSVLRGLGAMDFQARFVQRKQSAGGTQVR